MSIEKNLQTLADNSERIATALEGILSAISNGKVTESGVTSQVEVKSAGVTSSKDDADAEAAAKAEKAKKAAAAKAAKEEAAKAAAEADKAQNTGSTVSYDAIKAVVTELAGKGPDGITAIKSVLKKYGAAKASDVPEDKWEELLQGFEKAKDELEGGGDFA